MRLRPASRPQRPADPAAPRFGGWSARAGIEERVSALHHPGGAYIL